MTVSHRRTVGIYLHLEVLQYDSGFTAISSGVRVPLEFKVHALLEIILDNHSQAKAHVRSKFKRASGKACRVILHVEFNACKL
jgi:hypothetical protein